MRPNARIVYFLFLSIIAAGLLLAVAHIAYAPQESMNTSDKLFVSGAFIAGCVVCISMTIYPNWPSVFRRRRAHEMTGGEGIDSARGSIAHHPDCDSFRDHRIVWGEIELCSGCFGLMIGAAASILLMVVYIFMMPSIPGYASDLAIPVGFCALSFALIVSLMQSRGVLINTFANALMVPSLFLLTAGMFEITNNLYAGLLPVLFSFLWMDTRIEISQWHHTMTCCKCSQACKMY